MELVEKEQLAKFVKGSHEEYDALAILSNLDLIQRPLASGSDAEAVDRLQYIFTVRIDKQRMAKGSQGADHLLEVLQNETSRGKRLLLSQSFFGAQRLLTYFDAEGKLFGAITFYMTSRSNEEQQDLLALLETIFLDNNTPFKTLESSSSWSEVETALYNATFSKTLDNRLRELLVDSISDERLRLYSSCRFVKQLLLHPEEITPMIPETAFFKACF